MRTVLMAAGMAAALVTGAAAQDRVYTTKDSGVKAPVLVREVKPTYTDGAMSRKVQGTVELTAVIRPNGVPDTFVVIRPLDDELDQQAIAAVQKWEFKPGTLDGKPVAVSVNIELTFTLRDRK